MHGVHSHKTSYVSSEILRSEYVAHAELPFLPFYIDSICIHKLDIVLSSFGKSVMFCSTAIAAKPKLPFFICPMVMCRLCIFHLN